MNRKCCKECPWKSKSKHNSAWPKYFSKILSIKGDKKFVHACHMVTSDVWGMKTIINESNVCIGAKNTKKQKDLRQS